MCYIQYTELSGDQWKAIDNKVESLAERLVKNIDLVSVSKGEIHEQEPDHFEQREYIGSYYIFESEIIDIIEEETGLNDGKLVDGFYETVDTALDCMSNMLSDDWYVYTEDGDFWIARHWDSKEDIPEELQGLVNEY